MLHDIHLKIQEPPEAVSSLVIGAERRDARSMSTFDQHAYMAELSSRVLGKLFSCPAHPPESPASPVHLTAFIAYLLRRAKVQECVPYGALLLLWRLKLRFPSAGGCSGHRLMLGALSLASKVLDDFALTSADWSRLGIFAAREVTRIERELCVLVGWDLAIDGPSLEHMRSTIQLRYGTPLARSLPAANSPIKNYLVPDDTASLAKVLERLQSHGLLGAESELFAMTTDTPRTPYQRGTSSFESVTRSRSVQEHANHTMTVYLSILLGFNDCNHPEVRAFRQGFRGVSRYEILDSSKDPIKWLLADGPDAAFTFIYTMYERRLKSLDQVLSRIAFRKNAATKEADVLFKLFEARFMRWIKGRGHPDSCLGTLVDEEAFEAARGDPMLRARMFLDSIVGTQQIPLYEKFEPSIPSSSTPSVFFHTVSRPRACLKEHGRRVSVPTDVSDESDSRTPPRLRLRRVITVHTVWPIPAENRWPFCAIFSSTMAARSDSLAPFPSTSDSIAVRSASFADHQNVGTTATSQRPSFPRQECAVEAGTQRCPDGRHPQRVTCGVVDGRAPCIDRARPPLIATWALSACAGESALGVPYVSPLTQTVSDAQQGAVTDIESPELRLHKPVSCRSAAPIPPSPNDGDEFRPRALTVDLIRGLRYLGLQTLSQYVAACKFSSEVLHNVLAAFHPLCIAAFRPLPYLDPTTAYLNEDGRWALVPTDASEATKGPRRAFYPLCIQVPVSFRTSLRPHLSATRTADGLCSPLTGPKRLKDRAEASGWDPEAVALAVRRISALITGLYNSVLPPPLEGPLGQNDIHNQRHDPRIPLTRTILHSAAIKLEVLYRHLPANIKARFNLPSVPNHARAIINDIPTEGRGIVNPLVPSLWAEAIAIILEQLGSSHPGGDADRLRSDIQIAQRALQECSTFSIATGESGEFNDAGDDKSEAHDRAAAQQSLAALPREAIQ
ncbi:Alternative cyclin Pcl12 [Mycena kentingensis (nom. inval.)]|nr:Alternative cyclin Pcl12 [Mycena kentingensis (nom. inval.)]